MANTYPVSERAAVYTAKVNYRETSTANAYLVSETAVYTAGTANAYPVEVYRP